MHTLNIDFSHFHPQGRFRPLHGVNNGPLNWGGLTDLSPYHAELAIPFTRLHDPNWPNPDVVDINAVFPDLSADPSRPDNYTFERTDEYIKAIVELGSQVIYRLGHGIEHTRRKFHVGPPRDMAHWEQVCIGIIRHYNEGWADGYHYGIRYWEIWNEPDLKTGPLSSVSPTWGGTWEDYFWLYTVAARAIKSYANGLRTNKARAAGHSDVAESPTIMVGGPAMTGGGVASGFLAACLDHCRTHNVPLDFCSWHHYTADPRELTDLSWAIRRLLDEYGFTSTLSVLDEWNYIPPGMDWGILFNPAYPREQRRISQEIAGPVGAAFDVAALLMLQDCPVDIAAYYLADAMPYFSMFDVYGVPQKAFYAFKAFRWLLDTPRRVQVLTEVADESKHKLETGLIAGAGISDDDRRATILVSNREIKQGDLALTTSHLPWDGAVQADIYLLDADHDLELVRTERFIDPSFTLSLPLTPSSTWLITLSHIDKSL